MQRLRPPGRGLSSTLRFELAPGGVPPVPPEGSPGAAVLTAMAVSAVGVVGAVLVGALLLVVADTRGRPLISPAQVPAGLVAWRP